MSELVDANCIDLDGCENEAIERLFPRCQLKRHDLNGIDGKRDLNLNRLLDNKLMLNDNDYLNLSENHDESSSVSRQRILRNSWQEDNRMDDDNSLQSAYNIAGRGLSTSNTGNNSSEATYVNDKDLDIGYRIKTLNNLDSTRIELAGGREKISQSVMRNAKKKHSDEAIRNNPHSITKANVKRYSGEVLYDDEMKEYKVKSWNQHQSNGSKTHKTIRNFAVQHQGVPRSHEIRRISPTSPQEDCNPDFNRRAHKKSYKWIYEAPVPKGADVENDMQMSSGENPANSSQQPSPVGKITRLIGNLPIAEYDGSPRRYGPRPGFPLRVAQSDEQNLDGREIDSEPIQSNDEMQLESKCNGFGREEANLENGHANGVSDDVSSRTDHDLEYKLYRLNSDHYIGKRLAQSIANSEANDSPTKTESKNANNPEIRVDNESVDTRDDYEIYNMLPNDRNYLHDRVAQHSILNELLHNDHDRDTISNPDTEDLGETEVGEQVGHSRNFTLSPETTDCDSNDLESELSADMNDACSLEQSSNSRLYNSMPILEDGLSSGNVSEQEDNCEMDVDSTSNGNAFSNPNSDESGPESGRSEPENPTAALIEKQIKEIEIAFNSNKTDLPAKADLSALDNCMFGQNWDVDTSYVSDNACVDNKAFLKSLEQECLGISPLNTCGESDDNSGSESVSQAIREIKEAIQHSRSVILKTPPMEEKSEEDEQEPVWVPRQLNGHKHSPSSDDKLDKESYPEEGVNEEDEVEEETDRLLGVDKQEDPGFFEENAYRRSTMRNASSVGLMPHPYEKPTLKPKYRPLEANDLAGKKKNGPNRSKEVIIHEPAVLIEGVLFRARYLGSTQLVCEGQPTKATRMMQAEEAVSRIKAPEGESQPSTDVDLFISTEKIMVLNTDLKEIMMDHALRTISYIADIGELVVLMARRRPTAGEVESNSVIHHTPKMICHVFESDEAQFIAQSIGQAFQVAYMEFLKANGIEDSSFVKEMDYQEVLNSQQIFGDELEMFAKKDKQREVIVPKAKGEILGMVIVESGWGSMLPTVVIANMAQGGPGARCGQLNIGDQIIAINGISLVGLPLSTCQTYIKNTRNQTVVKLTMVPCPPVVEVKIKRPDTKYQLGFSVQNGVICSLLRGGIAERGGVRVGHRIIEINSQSVVAVPHERIVNLLATSVGEINMKTMPTSMFRLLTGQDTPIYI